MKYVISKYRFGLRPHVFILLRYAAQYCRGTGPAGLCAPRPLLPTPILKDGGKWGVWGEGGVASGSPHNYSARLDLWHKGPWRPLVPHESQGSVRSPCDE